MPADRAVLLRDDVVLLVVNPRALAVLGRLDVRALRNARLLMGLR